MTEGYKRPRAEPGKPFRLARYFAATSLVVIIVFAVALAGFLGNRNKQVLLDRYEEYALLLSINLNHQVFQQFVLPTVSIYGRINLSSEYQSRRMDKVVKTTIESLKIDQVNIYDVQGVLVYSTEDRSLGEELGQGPDFEKARSGQSVSRLLSSGSLTDYLLHRRLTKPVKRRTMTPFVTEEVGLSFKPRSVLGVFELTMDLTDEMEQIYKHQILAAAVTIGLLGLLFVILTLIVRQGEKILNRQTEESKQLEDQLRNAERLAALGRMVASVSHEIKNPLGIIRSTGELLAKRLGDQDPSRQLTDVVIEECSRLNRIVTEFLDFARPQEPNLRPVEVGELLERNLTALGPELEKNGIELVTDLKSVPRIMADPDLLYRVFLNIFINAVQAMPQGGRLSVSARPGPRGTGCLIEAADTGPGISPQERERVFDPFYTLKESGSGLGLSIVKSIIEAHHGEVEIVSAPGEGTRVMIRI